MRQVWIDRPERNQLFQYGGNRISNSKYTFWTFLPRNLFEQFQRFMNRYFLLIACLQLVRNVAPVSPLTTWLPLLFIFAVTAIKEAADDLQRHRADRLANMRMYVVVRGGLEMRICSQDICVGDVVCVENDSEFPCDMVLIKVLGSGGSQTGCYIQTANIDGETDLKHRKVPRELLDILSAPGELERLYRRQLCIKCPAPNDHVYSFDSALELADTAEVVSLNSKNLLLQGTFLRNSGRVYGVAVYTGNDTKLGMNKTKPDVKLTQLDSMVDRSLIFVFFAQMALVLVFGVIGNGLASDVFLTKHWYIEEEGELSQWYHYLVIPARMLLLFSLMIPISLKVTLDICKYLIACFIEWDLKMYDSETDEHCVASNTSIAEDLGQIQYVFTDKTGTLTENNMVFRKCSIAGRIYGRNDELGVGKDISSDIALLNCIRGSTSRAETRPLDHFFYCLTLCHSVMPSSDAQSAGKRFIATSPDEEALVLSCANLGFTLESRIDDELIVNVNGSKKRFIVLKKLEFTSERKRMSVFVQNVDSGKIFLYSKGADETILNSCAESESRYKIEADIDHFAKFGLRTLCIAYREVDHDDFDRWLAKFDCANTSLENREENVLQCYSEAENGLILLGVTAIEDRLQEHVAYTITQIRSAGIKVWVLTGDKMETAIQVARSSGLLHDTSRRTVTPLIGGDEVRLVELVSNHKTVSELALDIEQMITELCEQRSGGRTSISITRFCLVIDGVNLRTISKDTHCVKLFVDLAQMATSVICCRVSPHQKSSIVYLMKQRGKVTLAIGDGGNDVAMIQMAHVGIGVKGKEGLQAVRASDYSISKFSHLLTLVLIHGRFAYKRMAFVALYCLYKSISIGVLQVLFEFYCGFSGASFLNAFSLSLYNVVFTSLPIILFVQDKDMTESSVYMFPDVYEENISRVFFNWSVFSKWIAKAVMQACFIFFVVLLIFDERNMISRGYPFDELLISMTAYSCAIVVQNLAILLASNSLTWINIFLIFGSIVVYFIVTAIFSVVPVVGLTGTADLLFNNLQFWLTVLIVISISLIPDLLQKYYSFNYRPMFYQRIQMYELDIRDRNVDVHRSDIALPSLHRSESQSTNSRTPLTSSSSD